MHTVLRCAAVAFVIAYVVQPASANEASHRHLTHEGLWKNRALPSTFHHGDPFAALKAHEAWKARFQGPGGSVFLHHTEMHHLSARPHL